MNKLRTFLLLGALALSLTASAQVPQLVNYQGRVAVGTTNFDGAGSFKFALVNAAGSTTYWSNDGTSAAGSQPTAAVALTVTKGLYSVLLGDTALPNMTAIPASVWANPDVRLRVWFNDGSNGSQLLTPDQRLAPNGYLPDGAVGSAALASGAVTSGKLAGGAVGSAQLASGAVQTANLAAGAVGNAQLANSAVTVTAGSGLGGGGAVSLGGSVTLTNGGVLSLTGGGGITVNAATGAITLGSNATSANTAGAIVLRDGSGNFSAGTITAALLGNASTATSAASFSGALAGNVTGTQGATVVATVGTSTAANVHAAELLANAATNANTAGAIVKRDASGNFAAGSITAAGNLSLSATNSAATVGVITQGGNPLIHTFGTGNFFAGGLAGNFSMTGSSNTACGSNVFIANTTGSNNTASGYRALYSNTTGFDNTASGFDALHSNTMGSDNTANGTNALYFNTTGASNTASGFQALYANTADNNTAFGYQALNANTTGTYNAASGFQALKANTTGIYNTALGPVALFANQGGSYNTATGAALYNNIGGSNNTASGHQALNNNISGSNNTASGYQALYTNTADSNTAFGYQALVFNTTGTDNTAVGFQALFTNTGLGNIAVGNQALYSNTTGNNNAAFGNYAGGNLTTGNGNIDIGSFGVAGEDHTIRIGGGVSAQTKTFIVGIRGVTTGVNNAIAVVIDSNGQLGTVSSSRRYKEDIADMGDASARLLALRPVTFRYRKPYSNGEKPVQFGLIAEEVAETFPELAVFNEQGQPETVKYQDLAPLLLNEVQNEHRRADAKDAEIADLKKQLAETNARLSRLESLIPPAPTTTNPKGN